MENYFKERNVRNMSNGPRIRELEKPAEIPFPYKKEYICDVAVVGCGFAGLNAAVSAKLAGQSVLVIDKGRPGYSGLAPWPSSFRWFDPERDDADACRQILMKGGDYISNMGWYDIWIKESKKIFQRLMDWGILTQFPKASEAGDFFEKEDFPGYRETFEKFDRHQKWTKVLEENEIPWIEHTMAADVLTENGKVQGVLAMHVPTGEFIVIRSKAVVLATGGGCYKPTGFPVGGDTFDGEYICYHLGLPIAGKEFEDFHDGPQAAPGNAFLSNNWTYLENIWLCGGDMTSAGAEDYIRAKSRAMVMRRVNTGVNGAKANDGSEIASVAKADYTRRGASVHYETDPQEIRSGKMNDDMLGGGSFGAAVGMSAHLTSGVFTGLEEFEGKTSVLGLYVAGDGIHSTAVSGAAYPCGVGFTSCFCSIDGDHAGAAAAAYAKQVMQLEISDNKIERRIQELKAPYDMEQGIDPNWACDVLQSIMSPYWVLITKSETMLKAALIQVEYLRDNVMPKLMARSGHDLRLCMEVKHKVLSAELKLRASLERKESRGNSYRVDYPYRKDDEYLCYLVAKKGMDGNIEYEKVPVKEEWTGDRSIPYEKRFAYFFPGELEALGLEVEHERHKN
jgi:succinate dehydrogenase/fumarate reductase flavoprotein subunit